MRKRLLDEIGNGKRSYDAGDYETSQFQDIVTILEALREDRLINASFHRESSSGERSVDLVHSIELTDAGRASLGTE